MALSSDPDRAAADVASALTSVATGLFEADSSPDIAFVRAQADAGDPKASGIAAELALLWQEYSLAKDASDDLTAAVAARDQQGAARLLGPTALTLPSGASASLERLVTGMPQRLAAATSAMGQLAASARQALAKLDATNVEAGSLVARANALGIAGDPEMLRLRTSLDAAIQAVAKDPATDPAGLTDQALDAARQRVEEMERQKGNLPAALAQARALVGDIERLAAQGADDHALADEKVASAGGLLRPIAGDDPRLRNLGPDLARMDDDVASGLWDRAGFALSAWRTTADALHAEVAQIAKANAAPVARRNELRGQLQAFRAKSLAVGHGEHPARDDLHDQAQRALHSRPCDLAAAERLVRDYINGVNATAPGDRR